MTIHDNICREVYLTVMHRAEYGYPTSTVRLPSRLFAKLAVDEMAWLKNVLRLSLVESKELTTPDFVE